MLLSTLAVALAALAEKALIKLAALDIVVVLPLPDDPDVVLVALPAPAVTS